jgi:hypothetical protein
MRPQPPPPGRTCARSREVRLEKIRLDQVVRLLYAVDTADALLQVKNLRLKTRFDDRTLFDATMTVAAFGSDQMKIPRLADFGEKKNSRGTVRRSGFPLLPRRPGSCC